MNAGLVRRPICLAAVLLAACSGGSDIPADSSLVFEGRQARQCESGGITSAASAQKLIDAGIDVLRSSCGSQTGVAYPAVCGGPTGAILIHEIRTVNLPDAEQLGFRPIEMLVNAEAGTGYVELDCAEG